VVVRNWRGIGRGLGTDGRRIGGTDFAEDSDTNLMKKKRLLVTGVSGLLGDHVARQALEQWHVLASVGGFTTQLPIDVAITDFSDPGSIVQLGNWEPDVTIHCAAISEGRICDQDPERAIKVNVEATEQLAKAVTSQGKRFIFLSTDLVFDGKTAPYDEASLPTPLGWYGRTKAMAEERLLAMPNTLVVRTSLLFGASPRGNRSADERLIQQVNAGIPAKLFTDEFRCPLAASDLASALLDLAESAETGIRHVVGPQCLSRYAIGMQLAKHFGWPPESIVPSSIHDFPGVRPANLCLTSTRPSLKTQIWPLAHWFLGQSLK
jgi:dTDP-4-dehydrorhamnose reductase